MYNDKVLNQKVMENQLESQESVTYKNHAHSSALANSPCTECDCEEFIPSTETSGGGNTCINKNSAGGTCNHTRDEHVIE